MQSNPSKEIAVIGAGLVGSLLSIYLARRGHTVTLYERRVDMRSQDISAGRSINLAVSTRGIHALKQVGLDTEVLKRAIPMQGRMIHSLEGELTFQRYGKDDSEHINSISRGELNKALMTAAENTGRVKILFDQKIDHIDLKKRTINDTTPYSVLFGTDGTASVVRKEMISAGVTRSNESLLSAGYKELTIRPAQDGGFKMEKNALHIWPRGNFMLIALPNFDGSFTCTLFLPFAGPVSFEQLNTSSEISAFFNKYFKDAVPLIHNLTETFMTNPTGQMITVKSEPWNHAGDVMLMGDAAHGIVPFFGQGMNCGFEDCTVLDQLIDSHREDWSKIFPLLSKQRKPDADAIADMAVENFIEMRDKVGNKEFLLQKEVEKILQKEFSGLYISRYSLVSFSRTPYHIARELGAKQDQLLAELCQGLTRAQDVDLTRAKTLIQKHLGSGTWT